MNQALAELERRHEALEKKIAEALPHQPADGLMIADLKRRRLHIRNEIDELRDKTKDERP
jgi:hypothetical protein